MADHIHKMHNKTKGKLLLQKRDNNGKYKTIKEIPAGQSEGNFHNHDLMELRFITQSPRPVYFKLVYGQHKGQGQFTHIDGEAGHPEGFGDG